jgi:hypothetical protein
MFRLLSGEYVHEGDNAPQLMVSTATKPARSLAAVAPETDPHVVAVVDRALAFAREDRWESAEQMRDALREVAQQLFGAAGERATLAELVPSPQGSSEKVRLETTTTLPSASPKVPVVSPRATTGVAGLASSSAQASSAPDRPRAGRGRLLIGALLGLAVVGGVGAFLSTRGGVRVEPMDPPRAIASTEMPSAVAPPPSMSLAPVETTTASQLPFAPSAPPARTAVRPPAPRAVSRAVTAATAASTAAPSAPSDPFLAR